MKAALALPVLLAFPAFCQTQARPYLTEPHLAPDRPEIAFVSGGDIWRVAANGGEASLLVAGAGEESRPLYSPDGKSLAFVSTRTGDGDIYVLALATGQLRRLTFTDGTEQLDAWSRDGQWLYFHAGYNEIASMNDVFRVRPSGGTPVPVAADRYTNEFFSAPSPDGKLVALNARGIANRQWWRKGHSHLDQSEILLLRPGASPIYERITDGGAKEIWPMWAPDGKSLFFVSDRTGVENVWRQPLGGTSRQLTPFKDGRVLWPAISYDGKTMLFERDFRIWKMETKDGKASALSIQLRGLPAGPPATRTALTSFDEMALSPDGRKLALVGRGEVFAAPAGTGGPALAVTNSSAHEYQVAWSPDSRKLVYVSDRNGPYNVYLYDFDTQAETRLTSGEQSDAAPRFSPDGKSISYTRGGSGLWVYEIATKQERQLTAAVVGRQPLVNTEDVSWSPDSRYLAYVNRGTKGFSNVWIVPAAGGETQAASFLANGMARTVAWHPQGQSLYFSSSQRTEQRQIARVDLVPRIPRFREDQFRDLFRAAPETDVKTPKPVEIVWEGIRQRLTLPQVGLDMRGFQLSPDGNTLLVVAEVAGQENLYTYSLREPRREEVVARQLTSTAGPKSDAQFAPGGREVWYLERGLPHSISLESRTPKAVAVTAELDIDFEQDKHELFRQAWTYTADHFFDEKYNGVNWDALRGTYAPLVAGARTRPELHRILNLMHGELNASHSGVSAGPARTGSTTGALGLRFDPAALEKGNHAVAEVIALSPAAIAGVQVGETLAAVNGRALETGTSLPELLQHQAGKRLELTLLRGSESRKLAVQPVNPAAEKELLYRAWVESRRAYVDKQSGGKLGYVHLPDMSDRSLARLYLDLDTGNHARQGVVVDVRNNSGGFVNAYALDVFTRKPYLTFLERGRQAVPGRSTLGQRALELPTVLVTNQHSLSDAEDFSEGYRRLKAGRIVGEPTAGWIVYTWNQRLIDGSQLRLPRTKVFDNDGQLMEMHPRPVDVPVQRPVGESYSGKDVQLDVAVAELLRQLEADPRPASSPAGFH